MKKDDEKTIYDMNILDKNMTRLIHERRVATPRDVEALIPIVHS